MERYRERVTANEGYDYEYRYQHALNCLEQSNAVSSTDKKLIKDSLVRPEALGKSKDRLAKYRQTLRMDDWHRGCWRLRKFRDLGRGSNAPEKSVVGRRFERRPKDGVKRDRR